jgi:large subunit ribosomal protein L29
VKAVEARDLDVEDLNAKLVELKEEQFNLRFQLATGQLDNHRRLRLVRREAAMIRTILRERELEEWEALQSEGAPETVES